MELAKVESSIIEALGYDEKRKIMHVKFKNGSLYEYYYILPDEFKSIKEASSIGKQLKVVLDETHPIKSYKKL